MSLKEILSRLPLALLIGWLCLNYTGGVKPNTPQIYNIPRPSEEQRSIEFDEGDYHGWISIPDESIYKSSKDKQFLFIVRRRDALSYWAAGAMTLLVLIEPLLKRSFRWANGGNFRDD